MDLPGSSLGVTLRPHQKDAIWRGIQDGTALFDHVVGAGKTLAVVGTIMESKRMGLMKKPMVVVPNHLLLQWQDAFYQMYPQANILVADKNDFKKENREKLFAKVATNDYDAVIVAHSSFKKIGLPPDALEKVLTEQINDLTNDARKAGLDYRLIDQNAPDYAGSKVNDAAGRIFDIWQKWEAEKGTQLVFCDLSTPRAGKNIPLATPHPEGAEDGAPVISMDELLAESSPFSVYEDLKQKLMERGIPADQIRFIHEANTDAQKARLFDDMNQGRVRVLMGSTAKMGAGTNVQRRLVALHHLDAPWRPSDLAQREGRIIRQGNMFHERDPENFEVEIYRYATEKTYDARMWQTIQAKAEGIEQFRKGDLDTRTIEDVSSEAANAAEMKAAATGNELIFTQVKLAAELKKLEAVYASHQRNQHQLESRIRYLEKTPERTAIEICAFQQEIALRDKNTTTEPCFAALGKVYGPKQKERVLEIVKKSMQIALAGNTSVPVGQYRGFKVAVQQVWAGECQFSLTGQSGVYNPDNLKYGQGSTVDMGGLFQRMDNFLAKFEAFIKSAEESAKHQAQELAEAKKSQAQTFPHLGRLESLRRDNREVLRELQIIQKNPAYKSAWQPSTPGMAGEQTKTAAQGAAPARIGAPEPAVTYIQAADRGSFPVFNDRRL